MVAILKVPDRDSELVAILKVLDKVSELVALLKVPDRVSEINCTGWSKSPLTFESAAASSSEGEVGRARLLRYGMLERSMGI